MIDSLLNPPSPPLMPARRIGDSISAQEGAWRKQVEERLEGMENRIRELESDKKPFDNSENYIE